MKIIDSIKKFFQKKPTQLEPILIELSEGDYFVLTTKKELNAEQINRVLIAFKDWVKFQNEKPLLLQGGIKLQILRKSESTK